MEHEYDGLDVLQRDRNTGAYKPSVLERVQSFLAQYTQQGLVAGLDQTKFAVFPDVSHWNGNIDLAKMPYIAGLWTKACDGKQMNAGNPLDKRNYIDKTLHANIQKAYDVGVPCGIYIYFQPIITDYTHQSIIDWHYSVFKEAVKGLVPGKSYHAIAIDVEEKGDTGVNIRDKVMGLYNLLRADPEFANLPIVFYTSMAILNMYPAWRDAISYQGANHNLWLAQWAYSGTQTTWEALVKTIIPTLNMKVPTPGYATWKMLQWGVFGGLAGCPGACDINFYRGTKEEYWKWLNYIPRTTPPPVDPDPEEPEPTDPDIDARFTALETEMEALRSEYQAHIANGTAHNHTHGQPISN